MTPTMPLGERCEGFRSLIADLQRLQGVAMAIGLPATHKALNDAMNKAGWERSEQDWGNVRRKRTTMGTNNALSAKHILDTVGNPHLRLSRAGGLWAFHYDDGEKVNSRGTATGRLDFYSLEEWADLGRKCIANAKPFVELEV